MTPAPSCISFRVLRKSGREMAGNEEKKKSQNVAFFLYKTVYREFYSLWFLFSFIVVVVVQLAFECCRYYFATAADITHVREFSLQ